MTLNCHLTISFPFPSFLFSSFLPFFYPHFLCFSLSSFSLKIIFEKWTKQEKQTLGKLDYESKRSTDLNMKKMLST